ncbi:MAG: cytochrome c [Bacteroidota bacterium]
MKYVFLIIVTIVFSLSASSFVNKQQPRGKKTTEALNASIARGEKVYKGTCIACHQAKGQGVDRMNPPLIKTKWVLGDKKALARIVLFGLKGGEIIIDGDDFHNPMPAQGEQFTDLQIADVLTYIRNSFGNKAGAVTTADVKIARATPAGAAAKTPASKTPAKKNVKH